MRFFWVSFVLNAKKIIAKKAMWIGLILLFLTVSFGGAFAQTQRSIVVLNAGVFYNPSVLFEASVARVLDESVRDIPFIQFIFYDDLEELYADVAFGRLECGYVLNSDLGNGEFEGVVTVIVSPRTIATPILNDIVAAAILRVGAEDITRDGLISIFGESEELNYFVERQFLAYNEMDIFMVPSFIGEYGHAHESAPNIFDATASRVLYGLIGLTILIMSLFCTGMFIEGRASALNVALRAHGKLGLYDFSLWASAFAVMFTIGLSGLMAKALFAPNFIGQALSSAAALAFYAAVCSLFLTLASRFLKSAGLIQSFGLFLVILNIFFGGVLLDLAEISEALSHLQRLFPLFWYIEMSL